ncbi:SET domain-containing protein [Bimuria novae-zelandiae CBS 107.79]|uniref:SET domain-containing protein n=1 Tax=Bimuria novae-zelandiae CBS 107.79 TaxID=1447943 RepID=A0A6A5US89_9PLEO|nr:SET domain-containing protein [Bimuria novae-zelandiae CBS 107.79]
MWLYPRRIYLNDPTDSDNEFYEIRAVTGKGYGCFALKDLKRGTRILSDRPILSLLNGDYLKADIEEAFEKMSAEEKELYWSLASANGQDPKTWPSQIHESVKGREVLRIKEQHDARVAKEPSLLSIFQNNCMEQGKGCAIFPHASRFNHSCSPNASFNWNSNIQQETIHIIHDVKKGDEITLSYCDMTHEKTLRAWELKHYGFTCDCLVCTSEEDDPEGFARQSIARRYRIKELDHMTSYLRGPNLELGVKEPEFVKQLLELAVLHMEIGDYSMRLAGIYVDLAMACEVAGDFAHGRDMAANALRIKRDCQGEDSPDYDKYKGILKRLNRKYKEKKAVEEQAAKEKAQDAGAAQEDI